MDKKLRLAKTELKEIKKKMRWWTDIDFTCIKCKRPFYITTTKPELYTKDVIKKIICYNCKFK